MSSGCEWTETYSPAAIDIAPRPPRPICCCEFHAQPRHPARDSLSKGCRRSRLIPPRAASRCVLCGVVLCGALAFWCILGVEGRNGVTEPIFRNGARETVVFDCHAPDVPKTTLS